MEDESELRTKLAVDIEKYQQDASISSAAASSAAPTPTTAADAKAKNLDATLKNTFKKPVPSGTRDRSSPGLPPSPSSPLSKRGKN